VSRPLVLIALAVFAIAGLYPLVVMLLRVTGGDLAGLLDARTWGLLGRTLRFGLSVAGLALLIGLPFGFLVSRTDMPGALVLRTLGIVPLCLPPLLLAITLMACFPSLSGSRAAIAILGLSTFPLVALFSARAFERIDARLEEAALLAGGLPAVLRMELPLVLPAALAGACFAFAFAVNDFGVPDYVSFVNARFDPTSKFNVYADEIKLSWSQFERPGHAVAVALPLIALALAGLFPSLALRRRGAMATLVGGFRAPERLALGALRWPAFAFALGLVVLGAGLPIARLAWQACGLPVHTAELPLLEALARGRETFAGAFELTLERARTDLANSLTWAVCAALVSTVLGLVLGHGIERLRRGGRWLELGVLLPIAAPALLFGIGFIAAWNHPATARFYDGGGLVVLLFVGRYAPFAILIVSGATAALDRSLEESAALAGAGPARRLCAIVAPALRGSLAASFVIVFVLSMRDLDSAILVPAANRTAIFRVFNMVHFSRDEEVAVLSLLLVFAVLVPGLLWTLVTRRRLEVLP
jgi:iron(III) transport system permease protein